MLIRAENGNQSEMSRSSEQYQQYLEKYLEQYLEKHTHVRADAQYFIACSRSETRGCTIGRLCCCKCLCLSPSQQQPAAESGHRKQSETSELIKSGTSTSALALHCTSTIVIAHNTLVCQGVGYNTFQCNTVRAAELGIERCGDGGLLRNVIS